MQQHYLADGKQGPAYRQRLYEVYADPSRNEVVTRIYSFQPEDEAKVLDAHLDPSKVAAIPRERLTALPPGCEIFWKRDGARFVGWQREGDCVMDFPRSNTKMLLADDLELTASGFTTHTRAKLLNGEPLMGDAAPLVMQRRPVETPPAAGPTAGTGGLPRSAAADSAVRFLRARAMACWRAATPASRRTRATSRLRSMRSGPTTTCRPKSTSPIGPPTSRRSRARRSRRGTTAGRMRRPISSAVRPAGGKLIAWQGWADQSVLPLNTIDYYETAERTMGGRAATQEFFRLFMVPGMNHCIGGEGAHRIDYLSYIEDWVERGRAPDRLLAVKPRGEMGRSYLGVPMPAPADIEFSRPVFPCPIGTRYAGRGDPKSAESFQPVKPR